MWVIDRSQAQASPGGRHEVGGGSGGGGVHEIQGDGVNQGKERI